MTLDPPIKLVIFDLDETLIEKFGGLYDDTIPILEFLKQNNILCVPFYSKVQTFFYCYNSRVQINK